MKISTRGRYAFQLMIDLARHYDDRYIPLKDISERQNVSRKYLEQIIPFLTRSGLLLSCMGHTGGYRLARSPEEITILEILVSAEGSLTPVSCLDTSPNRCEECDGCMMLPVYRGLYGVMSDYLGSISLRSVADGSFRPDQNQITE